MGYYPQRGIGRLLAGYPVVGAAMGSAASWRGPQQLQRPQWDGPVTRALPCAPQHALVGLEPALGRALEWEGQQALGMTPVEGPLVWVASLAGVVDECAAAVGSAVAVVALRRLVGRRHQHVPVAA